jgi:hypothetical protein
MSFSFSFFASLCGIFTKNNKEKQESKGNGFQFFAPRGITRLRCWTTTKERGGSN